MPAEVWSSGPSAPRHLIPQAVQHYPLHGLSHTQHLQDTQTTRPGMQVGRCNNQKECVVMLRMGLQGLRVRHVIYSATLASVSLLPSVAASERLPSA